MINLNKVPQEWVEQFTEKISWEEAISTGLELREKKDNSQWELGDLTISVEKSYGVDSLNKFAIDILMNKNSLSQYRRVSKAFPPETRSKILSHRHHLMLAGNPDRFRILKECEDNNTTTSQLEVILSKNPQTQMLRKEVLVCEHCGKLIVSSKNICLGHS